MANANVKEHERLLEKKEDLRKYALKDIKETGAVENYLKNRKKSDKVGERAEGEGKKAKRRTERANYYAKAAYSQ